MKPPAAASRFVARANSQWSVESRSMAPSARPASRAAPWPAGRSGGEQMRGRARRRRRHGRPHRRRTGGGHKPRRAAAGPPPSRSLCARRRAASVPAALMCTTSSGQSGLSRQVQRQAGGLDLRLDRVCIRVPARGGASRREKFGLDLRVHLAVLGVDQEQAARSGDGVHQRRHRHRGQHEPALVGQESLERRQPGPQERRQLRQALRRRIDHRHVQAVVAEDAPVGHAPPAGQRPPPAVRRGRGWRSR